MLFLLCHVTHYSIKLIKIYVMYEHITYVRPHFDEHVSRYSNTIHTSELKSCKNKMNRKRDIRFYMIVSL